MFSAASAEDHSFLSASSWKARGLNLELFVPRQSGRNPICARTASRSRQEGSCRPPRFPLPSGQAGGRSSRGLQRPASRREHGGLDMLLIADTEAIIPTEGIAGPFTPDDRRAETARILEKGPENGADCFCRRSAGYRPDGNYAARVRACAVMISSGRFFVYPFRTERFAADSPL